eukprot:9591339-Lingulodinium_polyedra.AAC.1
MHVVVCLNQAANTSAKKRQQTKGNLGQALNGRAQRTERQIREAYQSRRKSPRIIAVVLEPQWHFSA